MKLTKKRYEIFSRAVYEALFYLGMTDWNVQIFKRKLKEADAQASTHHPSKRAFISINSDDQHVSDDDVINSGYHEVVEILLSPLEKYMTETAKKIIEEERHAIINRIVFLLEIIRKLEKQKGVKK